MKIHFTICVVSLLLIVHACIQPKTEVLQLVLSQGWEFREQGTSRWLPATVPGCVHSDLLTNGLIPDPFVSNNEDSVQWIEQTDWEYRTVFTLPRHMQNKKHIILRCKGLDTYANVFLNGNNIITADNMFIAHEARINEYVKEGKNELNIVFYSAVRKGMEKLQKLPYYLKASNEQAADTAKTNVFTRKAPFHYGWDWGPRLVTCGIWQDIEIVAHEGNSINDVFYLLQSLTDTLATYTVKPEIETKYKDLEISILVNNKKYIEARNYLPGTPLYLHIQNPRLWWPHGHGEAYLYDICLLISKNGKILDRKKHRIGVRSVEVERKTDSIGTTFQVVVNGKPVFAKGANYIPPHIYVSNVGMKNYRKVIDDALDVHMNMLRVWGGAIYEKDFFYDLCDEKGIMIWQDFMFACALQPGDNEHLENIRKEAEFNVRRLRNHACMTLWCGNNENFIAWNTWGWKNQYSPEVAAFLAHTYDTIFHSILPGEIQKWHPEILYWPSSPIAEGHSMPNRRSGDEHDWTIWFGKKDFEHYFTDVPRFCSEYGLQSMPEIRTIANFADSAHWTYNSPFMHRRQRSYMPWISPTMNGNELMMIYINRYFPYPANFFDYVYLSQIMQAYGLEIAVTAHRTSMPRCMGSLYWQLNDCWPTMSWSTVDFYGRWKAAHYMFKHRYKNNAAFLTKNAEGISAWVVNDVASGKDVFWQIDIFNADKKMVVKKDTIKTREKYGSNKIAFYPLSQLLQYGDSNNLVLRLYNNDYETTTLLCRPKYFNWQQANVVYAAEHKDNIYTIRLSADAFTGYVLLNSSTDGKFSDNYFHLFPGETRSIIFAGTEKTQKPASFRIYTLNAAMQQ